MRTIKSFSQKKHEENYPSTAHEGVSDLTMEQSLSHPRLHEVEDWREACTETRAILRHTCLDAEDVFGNNPTTSQVLIFVILLLRNIVGIFTSHYCETSFEVDDSNSVGCVRVVATDERRPHQPRRGAWP